jgi:hypothetical protein
VVIWCIFPVLVFFTKKNLATPLHRPAYTQLKFSSRTTTPNSLREHLKETLTKNLEGSDIAETIQVNAKS